mgnify:CR=1 FL=1
MIIRKAEKNELDDIMQVYKSCVSGMIALGIDQWDETYPNREIIEQDLEIGDYYVGLLGNEIVEFRYRNPIITEKDVVLA